MNCGPESLIISPRTMVSKLQFTIYYVAAQFVGHQFKLKKESVQHCSREVNFQPFDSHTMWVIRDLMWALCILLPLWKSDCTVLSFLVQLHTQCPLALAH